MKASTFALLTLTTLLFAFTTKLPLASAEIVLDVNGDSVFSGSHYYIMPAIWGPTGGGLYYGKTGNSTCPVTVLQHFSEVEREKPLVFQRPEIGILYITTDSPVEISFADEISCAESSKWIVVDSWVGIGGPQDHPGQELLSGEFKIQKHAGFGYKLVFCPTFTAHNGLCYNIGRKTVENERLLSLTQEDAFWVVFIKVDPISSII